jgi:hypothetical protein
MAYVFGNSFDSVAGQKNLYDNMALRIAESDRQARMQADQQAQQNDIFAQRQQEEDARQRADEIFRRQQAAVGQQQAGQQAATQRYQFGAELADKQASEAQRAKEFGQSLDLQKSQVAGNKAEPNANADYNEVVQRIDRGEIDDPNKIPALFPNLNPIQSQQAAEYWKQQNQSQQEGYRGLMATAQAATAAVKANRLAKVDTGKKTGGFMGFGGTKVPPTIADLPTITEDEALSTLASQRQFAHALPTLQWDETAQQFLPIVKQPKGYQFPGVLRGTAPAAVPPPPNLTGQSTNRFAFPPGAGVLPGSGMATDTPPPVLPVPAPPAPLMGNPMTRMPAPFYDRVNQLIGAGLDPRTAKAQAMAEFQQPQ